jgi:hypothetical protein
MHVMRKALIWIITLGVILWIVLSYLPQETVALPQVRFPASWDASFAPAALVVLALFVILQLALLWRVRLLRGSAFPGIRVGAELFWTALPLVLTIALGAVGYMTLAR